MYDPNERLIEILVRLLHGETVSVKHTAEQYNTSTKTITRDINRIKDFLYDHRDLMHNSELVYSYKYKAYILESDAFLKNEELFAIVKVILGCRCFSKEELLPILSKLKKYTTEHDREKFNSIIKNEIYHYHPVKSDCNHLIHQFWQLIEIIDNHQTITITYYKMNREEVVRKIKPASLLFSEYYFYLIAYDETNEAKFFRVDRIKEIRIHRENLSIQTKEKFDEGALRESNQFMFPGKKTHIRFAFSGPSVQAVLDRIPTARVIENDHATTIIEADVEYGRGLIMYLLSQGSWIKVLSPQSLATDLQEECQKMLQQYS